MSFFGKNIKKIRTVKNLSQQAFADIFGLKRATLGAYEEGRSEPKIDTVIKVANHFSVTIDCMLTRDLTVNELLKFKADIVAGMHEADQETFVEVPCITSRNAADYIEYFENDAFVGQLPQLKLPLDSDEALRGYTVQNLEMTHNDKGLYPNDVVVATSFDLKLIQELTEGSMVLVLTDEELILRRFRLSEGQVVLSADHINISEKAVAIDQVKELWVVKYVFFKRLPVFGEVKSEEEDKMAVLMAEINKIKSQMSKGK